MSPLMTCQAGTRTFNTPWKLQKETAIWLIKTGHVQYQITVRGKEIFKTKNVVIELLKPSLKSTESYICKLFIYQT